MSSGLCTVFSVSPGTYSCPLPSGFILMSSLSVGFSLSRSLQDDRELQCLQTLPRGTLSTKVKGQRNRAARSGASEQESRGVSTFPLSFICPINSDQSSELWIRSSTQMLSSQSPHPDVLLHNSWTDGDNSWQPLHNCSEAAGCCINQQLRLQLSSNTTNCQNPVTLTRPVSTRCSAGVSHQNPSGVC